MKLKTLFVAVFSLLILFTGCSSETTDESVPDGMQLLSDENVDFTAYVPSDWTVDMSTGTVSAYVSSVDSSNVSITGSVLEDMQMTPDEYWESYKADFETTFSDMEYVGEVPIATTLDSVAANKYVYTATVTGTEYQFMQVVCITGGEVYVITYTSTPDKYEDNIEDVESILDSFTFDD